MEHLESRECSAQSLVETFVSGVISCMHTDHGRPSIWVFHELVKSYACSSTQQRADADKASSCVLLGCDGFCKHEL
jgi:hypothetical protein